MGVGYNPKIVTNGLVLCLDAANVKSYPGSGTTWSDLSGNGNNGTLVNTPTFSSSGDFTFNGSTQQVNLGTFITAPNIKTMSVWVLFNSFAGDQEIISKSAINLGVEILIFNSSLQFFVMGGSGVFTNIGYPVSNLSTSVWYNVTATHNGAGGTPQLLYVNGAQVASGSTPAAISDSTNFFLGTWNSGSRFFNGKIATASVYNRALTAAEIQQNFNALRGRFGI